MPSNDEDCARFDADLTRVLVLDAELVRREGRSVCLVIRDARVPLSAPPRPTPVDPPPASSPPWMPQESWLPSLLGWVLVLLGGILVGSILSRHLPVREMCILLIIGVLLFGPKLPGVGRYLGKGFVEFKKGIKGLEGEASPPRTRRATVRYYSRMNPERVYPLLVLITCDLVAKVRKKHTDQRTSAPFAVDVETPMEIEPVLPGCDCYPPKVVTRLGEGDLTLTFRVVPRVLGKVDGAAVCIRQDHTSLAEIELDAKVVKQTWVALSGAATFLLPGLSAVMKHFGLDFGTQTDQGFSLYLAIARLVFDRFSPYALATLLGVATALLWSMTRPRTRDVFWDIEKVSPVEKLERIGAAMPAKRLDATTGRWAVTAPPGKESKSETDT